MSGRAVYNFIVTETGDYAIQAMVNAPTLLENSFLVNIDGEPQEPVMVWDIPVTSGFENRLVSIRGNGTFDHNEFTPKLFSLTAGTHQLIVLGREANARLQNFDLIKSPAPPQNFSILMPTPAP
jgi:hypothetical protein